MLCPSGVPVFSLQFLFNLSTYSLSLISLLTCSTFFQHLASPSLSPSMASQIHLWFSFFLWCFSKLHLTLSASHALACACAYFTQGLGLSSPGVSTLKRRGSRCFQAISKNQTALCVQPGSQQGTDHLWCSAPLVKVAEEPDTVPPYPHEGVSSNVKQSDCSILWDLGMHQIALTEG